ncbi:DUF1281 domain-containing protein [Salmonella enterica]|nr:DUF1281 domain-containing protein [Salmonella enterica]
MPNWCCNRMRFSAVPEQTAAIKALAEGAVTPFYRRATEEGIQLFVAGCVGLLQVTEEIQFIPYPALTAAGIGVLSPENLAFTRWLTQLQDGVLLDEKNSQVLHEIWLQSGIGGRRWETLSDSTRNEISRLYAYKCHDWCGIWDRKDVAVWWTQLCDNPLPARTNPFDLLLVLPSRLDVEINGFNGKLLDGIPSAYKWYLSHYGTKWPVGYELNICSQGSDFMVIDFDTPWSPASEEVVAELSKRYGCEVEHWFVEQGCNYCGYARYVKGETEVYITDELEWGNADPDDEDSFQDITCPEWIINNVAHFGG